MTTITWGVPVAVGAAATKVNLSAAPVAEVPPGAVTVTSVCHAGSAGEVAVIEVDEFTVTLVAAVAPNMTELAPVRLVPVTVTEVPPAVDPEAGLTPVTVGNAVEDPVAVMSTPRPPETPAGLWVAVGWTAADTSVS